MNRFLLLVFFCSSGIISAQQTEYVDFKRGDFSIKLSSEKMEVSGIVQYTFDVLKPTDSIYLDAIQMEFFKMELNEVPVEYTNDGSKLWIKHPFESSVNQAISFSYLAKPKKALYFVNDQIWTQGQGKYTSNWLPSIDDVNDKIEFDLKINYDKDYQVSANGELLNIEENDSTRTWQFNMNQSMSSYLVALAIGKYNKQTESSNSGIPLEYYYYPEDSVKVEPTYRYSKQMFDFLEEEIGVPYPWEIYKQVPVQDFLYAGMENTTLTIFSDAMVVDSIGFIDKNYVNVNAHELAHQWFGNLVTAKSGEHHWLQEGFSTYYALLAEREVFGEDYYYWRLYEYAQQLLEQEKAGESTSLLNPKSSSLTFYQKGCWALHELKEQVGEEAFKTAVKSYLEKYQFSSVETLNFIDEIELSSGQDLSGFVKKWLEDVALPQDEMEKSLNKSIFIQEYQMVDCEIFTSKCSDYLASDISDKAKVKVISQIPDRITKGDFRNGLEVRQAIAQNVTKISPELKKPFESLLNDPSYVTIESALYNLWVNFPVDRAKYLQQTKDVIGFRDHNVRLLWLALNLNTVEYQPENKQAVYDELKGYTSPEYGFELRMNAFNYLKLINGFDEFSIQNLMEATQHHNWRFQQFAKKLLEELKQNEAYKSLIEHNTKQ